MQHIAVIGAGITAVTTAYALNRRGFKVTVFDRRRYAWSDAGSLTFSTIGLRSKPRQR